jgi:hypothetical protein
LYSETPQLGLFQQASLNVISLLLLGVVAVVVLLMVVAVAVVLVEYGKEHDSH